MLLSLVLSALAVGTVAKPLQKRQSSVPFGVAIFACTEPNTIALTFDDGPYIYGDALLDILDAYNGGVGAKATFFMNGNNWDTLESQASYVQRAYNEGHQVASHTETHAHLSTLDAAGVTQEMELLEARFLTVLGVIPTYMRPPYLEYSTDTLSTLNALGYHVIDISIDTKDYEGDYTAAINNFNTGLASGGTVVLMHEVYEKTVETLLPEVLAAVLQSGKTPVTIGTCLGDAAANWYRAARSSSSTTSTTGVSTSTTSTAAGTSTSTSTTTGCTQSQTIVAGDYCYAIWTAAGLTEAQFRALNPTLNADCLLITGETVCIAGTPSTSTTSTTLLTTTSSQTTTTSSSSYTTTGSVSTSSSSSVSTSASSSHTTTGSGSSSTSSHTTASSVPTTSTSSHATTSSASTTCTSSHTAASSVPTTSASSHAAASSASTTCTSSHITTSSAPTITTSSAATIYSSNPTTSASAASQQSGKAYPHKPCRRNRK